MDNEGLGASASLPQNTMNLGLDSGSGGGDRGTVSGALNAGGAGSVGGAATMGGAVNMGGGSTRRTSRVWRYFGMVDNCHYICHLCHFVGAYTNTTNMRKHIQHHHPERFQDILDHTRPTTRPFYASLPRFRQPHPHYLQPQHQQPQQQDQQQHQHLTQPSGGQLYSGGILYPPSLQVPKKMVVPKSGETSFVPAESRVEAAAHAPQPHSDTIGGHASFAGLAGHPGRGLGASTSGLAIPCQASSPPTVTVSDMSPDETKLMNQLLPPLHHLRDDPVRGTSGGEERPSSEYSHNNGDEVPAPVSPPEQFLAEAAEREPTPTTPTPTQQKPESYQLRHNNHLTIVLEALARDESFMDVTLTAQGRSLKAHKSVLSAVSPYFRGVLRDNPCQHPIIIMPRDVRFEELFSIVNYIYKGEMTVAAEDLTSLLKTAEILQVSGLAPSDSTATVNPHNDSSNTGNVRASSTSSSSSSSNAPPVSRPPKPVKASPQRTTPPPVRPKSRDSSINPTDYMDVDMTCVKEEIASGGEEEAEDQTKEEVRAESVGSGGQEEALDQAISSFSPTYDTSLQLPSSCSSLSENTVASGMMKTEASFEGSGGMMEDPQPCQCPHCHEQHRDLDSLLSHLRIKHPTKPSFTCSCGRVFTRQLLLQVHSRSCCSSS